MLQILGRASSINVRKVLWTCDEIGLPFEREDWGYGTKPTKEPGFMALNPNAQVPVIKDGDFVLWESNTICRYLAAKHGRTDLLPAETRQRATVEQWMDWQATELNPAWRYAFYALVRKWPEYQDPQQIEASVAGSSKVMGILEGQLAKTGAYAAGAEFTLADIVLGLSVHRFLTLPMRRDDLPAVQAYDARLRQRAAFLPYAKADVP
jgi:glutathione S-transferase